MDEWDRWIIFAEKSQTSTRQCYTWRRIGECLKRMSNGQNKTESSFQSIQGHIPSALYHYAPLFILHLDSDVMYNCKYTNCSATRFVAANIVQVLCIISTSYHNCHFRYRYSDTGRILSFDLALPFKYVRWLAVGPEAIYSRRNMTVTLNQRPWHRFQSSRQHFDWNSSIDEVLLRTIGALWFKSPPFCRIGFKCLVTNVRKRNSIDKIENVARSDRALQFRDAICPKTARKRENYPNRSKTF